MLCGLVGWFIFNQHIYSISEMSEAKSWSRDNPMKFFEWLFFVPTSGQWAATFMFGVSICEEDKKAVEGEFSLSLQP